MGLRTEVEPKKKPKARPPVTTTATGEVIVNYVDIPVAKLVKAEWNYKRDDEEKAVKLAKAIKKRGQIVNLIVREMKDGKFEVVNGNHRLDALKTNAAASAKCVNLGKISTIEAQQIAIETNELQFDNDPFKLSEILTSITGKVDMDEMLETLPYTQKDLDALLNIATLGDEVEPEEDHTKVGKVKKDEGNPFLDGQEIALPLLLQSLNVGKLTSAHSELISEAIMQSRTELGIPWGNKDNTICFVHIFQKFLGITETKEKIGKKLPERKTRRRTKTKR